MAQQLFPFGQGFNFGNVESVAVRVELLPIEFALLVRKHLGLHGQKEIAIGEDGSLVLRLGVQGAIQRPGVGIRQISELTQERLTWRCYEIKFLSEG